MIGIICDSVVDIPQEFAKRDDVFVVPILVILEGKSFRENLEISKKEIIDYLENSFAKTSLPYPNDVMDAYREMHKRGYDEILVLNLSSGLSGTHNLFITMGEQFKSEVGDVQIEYVDSLSLSGGAAMLFYKALKMKERGDSLKVIASDLKKRAGSKNPVFFVIPTVKYLKESGRIGKLEGFVGQILKVKPVVTIDRKGTFAPVGRARLMKKAVETMVERLLDAVKGKKIFCVALYHSGDDPETLSLVSWVREKMKHLSEAFLTGEVSSGILVHGGKGIIGVGALIG